MNALVEEFNRTVGQEQGIRVRVDSVSNSGSIHESVLAAAYKDPGRTDAAGPVRVLPQNRAGAAG